MGDLEIPYFWPFTVSTYTFQENPVFSILHIIVPILLSVGVLSQFLMWLSAQYTYSDDDDDDQEDEIVSLEEWLHQEEDCDGCDKKQTTRWHRYTYNKDLGEGVQGWLYQVYYTLYNFWQHWLDNGLN